MDNKLTILFVDDEENVLKALRRLLMDTDYNVLIAGSGADGLAILEKNSVEVVVSDYRMPNMNGIEFLREVNRKWPETVRIVLSGYADAAAIVEAINDGQIYKFIPKPWNDDELRVTIGNAFERYLLYKRNKELTQDLIKANSELKVLLDERTAMVELEGKMLAYSQSFFHCVPVALVGIAKDGMVAQYNRRWAEDTGDDWDALGKPAEIKLPAEVMSLIEASSGEKHVAGRVTINSRKGYMYAAKVLDPTGSERGTVLVFLPEDRIP